MSNKNFQFFVPTQDKVTGQLSIIHWSESFWEDFRENFGFGYKRDKNGEIIPQRKLILDVDPLCRVINPEGQAKDFYLSEILTSPLEF